MKKNLLLPSSLVFFTIFFFGCSKYSGGDEKNNDSFFLKESALGQIITNVSKLTDGELHQRFSEAEITDYSMIKDGLGNNALYTVNYTISGDAFFAVISADTRTEPILAYGEGKFVMDSIPDGLNDWLDYWVQTITNIRNDDFEVASFNNQWDALLIPGDEGPCEGENTVIVGPLLATRWGQGCHFNDDCPTCDNSDYCGYCPTGCTATAMAQIMRFWSFPEQHAQHNYVWSSMPNNYGSTNIARLMRDIGDEVDMDYGCDGSGATSNHVLDGFDAFGYSSSVELCSFNGSTLRNELNVGRPALLTGGKKKVILGIPIYTHGHAWCCDGYRFTEFENCPGSLYYYRMNWGWSGYFNGWYSYGNFNPDNRDYNYHNEMIIGIKP